MTTIVLSPAQLAIFQAMTPRNVARGMFIRQDDMRMVVERLRLSTEAKKLLKALVAAGLVTVERLGNSSHYGYYWVIATAEGIKASGISDGQPRVETEPRRVFFVTLFGRGQGNPVINVCKAKKLDTTEFRAWLSNEGEFSAKFEQDVTDWLIEQGYSHAGETLSPEEEAKWVNLLASGGSLSPSTPHDHFVCSQLVTKGLAKWAFSGGQNGKAKITPKEA